MRARYARRRFRLRYAAAALVTGLGLTVLAYPVVDNAVYDAHVRTLKQEFLAQAGHTGAHDPYADLYALLRAENARLAATGQAGLVDAFSYQTTAVDLAAYGIADNRIGFVTVPAAGIDLPIYLGANLGNLSLGAVHLTQTSYPIGGPDTNAVIAAHRGGTLTMFRQLHTLALGDAVIITNFREQLWYEVVETRVIDPTDIGQIMIQPGRELVTLISCHPLGHNSQRLVVLAERVPGPG